MGYYPRDHKESDTAEHTGSDIDVSDGAFDRSGTTQALKRGFLYAGHRPGSIYVTWLFLIKRLWE